MNCHDMFMIMITWTQHDTSCHCLVAWCCSYAHESWWCCLKMTNNLKITKRMSLKITFTNSFLKYIRYKLNHSTCLHKNEITRFSQLSWKISKKFLNWNSMLIHNHLYLKNIIIWLMFLRDKKLMNWHHIEKNMTSELIWNQKRLWVLNLCMTCHETNCRYYDNTWMSILQKTLFNQVILHLHFWYCLQRNWAENYNFALIIKF